VTLTVRGGIRRAARRYRSGVTSEGLARRKISGGLFPAGIHRNASGRCGGRPAPRFQALKRTRWSKSFSRYGTSTDLPGRPAFAKCGLTKRNHRKGYPSPRAFLSRRAFWASPGPDRLVGCGANRRHPLRRARLVRGRSFRGSTRSRHGSSTVRSSV